LFKGIIFFGDCQAVLKNGALRSFCIQDLGIKAFLITGYGMPETIALALNSKAPQTLI